MQIEYHIEVGNFIHHLPKQAQAKIIRVITLLEKYGQHLTMPHVKKITPNLYELRSRGKPEVRLFFTFTGHRAYLLHGFIKKTQKTPTKEIKTAQNRLP